MKVSVFLLFVSLFLATNCLSYPQRTDPVRYTNNHSASKIVSHENNIGFGNYNFSYETSDGSHREEQAELKNPGTENEALAVHGSYTYVGTDGVTYKVTYVADENGYRASGEHIPKN
ncbi:endocuticle structural glycoprotein ABD-5-like [Anoplophora glabripennis]|uniref:endocuticle structural glycoprotein ABD-5-like n=1 Tax=Anoplophora glabripennis TaxID=217634 RepID=UPI000874E10B|nr:endocuticle structural glycoprotein ABD-5-like [Anoplophora glabripennis]